ncbi:MULTISPECIES: hypothetical protein [Zobellia]|uniref:hypothetical protein n=1 Tax=Zobellia TaxID=112040 RepID=UPI001BFFA035|nr:MULTISPECIES: hypothetical protein [Zobellia]MBT9186650.1 hypothetical protein [Zobellia russellii]MBU2974564.1 hypothetical protein [Zobellia sp. B3R18]MDO6818344.1 hypothetical protein [Zobellia sp. 1_MG-2023]
MNVLKETITDKEFLQNLIPQKPPFIMVGKLLEYSEKKIVSGLIVPEDNLFVFENRFMAPGLIENMAQTVALHTGYKYYLAQKPAPTGYIGAIKKATVNALPFVGQELETTVEILHDIMGITMVSATVTCEGIILATSEMKTALAN